MPPRARLFLGISILWIPLAFLFDGVTVLLLPMRLSGATEIGAISLLGIGIATGFQPLIGRWSDRHRREAGRHSFVVAGAAVAIVGLAALVFGDGLIVILLAYIVVQLGATTMQAAQQTLIPERVPRQLRGRASGWKTAFDLGGAFLAFALLGTLLAVGGLAAGWLAIVALVGASIGLFGALVPRRRERTSSPGHGPSMPAGLARLMVSRGLFLFGTFAVGRFLVLLVGDRLGVPPERAVAESGWLLALLAIVTAVAAVPVGRMADRWSRRDLMVGGSVLAAVGILLLLPRTGLAGIILGGLCMSLGTATFATANWAATTAIVPGDDAGRLMGIANLAIGAAAAAAGVIGPVIDTAGFAPALVLAAAVVALAITPLLHVPPGRAHDLARERAA